jgi:hypothetical protein
LSSLLSELESLKARIGSAELGAPPPATELPYSHDFPGSTPPVERAGPTIIEPEEFDALGFDQREHLRGRAEELRQATAAVAAAVDRLVDALEAVKDARSL